MTNEAISGMTPGTPPYALGTLLELSIPGTPYITESGTILDVVQSATNGGLTKGLNLPLSANFANSAGGVITLGSLTGGSGYVGGSAVLGFGALTAGSGYIPGFYANVALTDTTNGSATGVTATIIVGSDGLVKAATIVSNGLQNAGYAVNDVLTCANTSLGNSGSGWQVLVGTIGAIYTGVPFSGGSGTGAQGTFTVSGNTTGAIHTVAVTVKGVGYTTSDTLGVSAVSVGGSGTGFAIPVASVGSPVSAANTYLWESGTVTGSISAPASFGPASVAPFNSISLNDNTTGNAANVPIAALGIYDRVGAVGGSNRVAIMGLCDAEGAPTSANVNYTGGWFFAKGSVASGNNGFIFGVNPQAALGTGATGWKAVAGGECDVTASAGSNPVWKIGWVVTTTGSDAVHGSAIDAGYMLAAIGNAQNPTNGFNSGFLFSDNNGAFPVTTTGTMIGVNTALLGSAAVAIGIDFSGVTFSDSLIKGPASFRIDGSANITAATLTASGAVSASNLNVTASTLPTNGIYLSAASTLGFSLAGANQITLSSSAFNMNHSRNGSLALQVVNGNAGTATTAQLLFGNGNGASVAAITLNGSSFTGGAGASALCITNAASALIQLGGGSEVIEFGSSASFSANGAVATSLGSVGPTGASTTVQKWLTFKDNGGTTRYVPCF